MPRRTALKLPILAGAGVALAAPSSAAAQRWPADRAHRWYQAQGWLVGANFVTSNAVNQLEMFQPGTFDPRRIDTELHMARWLGFNTVRVFLHDQLWLQDPDGFLRRLGQFLDITARHHVKPLFVLFDSCWDPHPRLGRQRAPRPGVHNSGWVQSPGAEHLADRRYRTLMRDYVVGVVRRFRTDDRVLGWDLWNEPDNPADAYSGIERPDKAELVAEVLPQVFGWARSADPSQPLTSGVWDGVWADPARRGEINAIQLDNSDVITFHSYAGPGEFEARIAELAPLGRPMMCTEYMARSLDSTVQAILPITKRQRVGAYTWGLVAGKTQTYLPWDSWQRPVTGPPGLWFHDLLQPGGKPYRPDEVRTIQKLTGRRRLG
ncbi:1,4-beta-xylanase [Mycolicibacterium duvalii]|nr:1,4-beta-xylanase [Mycolicibacterium duvalii]MCV7366145.1 1,4-beta-xylanase [Mycolicibacterium duvalii]PEG38868.1 1,4-beta-xylanase [Mycolicibacterium duvalii]